MCPIKGSHKWIINAERHIKTFNEANVTAKNANNTHIIFIYVTLRERENKHFTPLIPLLAQIPPLFLPAHAWGAWRCDLCVFSVVFVCCHLSQISSWAPFLIFASSLDLPSVQPGQLADWLCVLRWGLWLATSVVNQRNEGGCSAREFLNGSGVCIVFTNQQR